MADRDFLLEDIKIAKFSLFLVTGLVKAIWVGKGKGNVLGQLALIFPLMGDLLDTTCSDQLEAIDFQCDESLSLRANLRLIFAEQDADMAADMAPMSSSLHSYPSILLDEISLRDETMLKLQEL